MNKNSSTTVITTTGLPSLASFNLDFCWFNSDLLVNAPIFKDKLEDFLQVFNYIKEKLEPKLFANSVRHQKFIKLEKEFKDLYATISRTKEDIKGKRADVTERPLYYAKCSSRRFEKLWCFGRNKVRSHSSRQKPSRS